MQPGRSLMRRRASFITVIAFGADEKARDISRVCGYRIIVHPPINHKERAFTSGDEKRELFPYSIATAPS
jgi:hypothetical protein